MRRDSEGLRWRLRRVSSGEDVRSMMVSGFGNVTLVLSCHQHVMGAISPALIDHLHASGAGVGGYLFSWLESIRRPSCK